MPAIGLADEAIYPEKAWKTKPPAEVGLSTEILAAFSKFVGGRGCVVRHGYLVYSWGDVPSARRCTTVACPSRVRSTGGSAQGLVQALHVLLTREPLGVHLGASPAERHRARNTA